MCHTNPAASSPEEAINNIYDFNSIECTIRYLHAAAGFPIKYTWIKSILNGKYLTWPLITVTNVHKHFPESEETQKGHMQNQRQGCNPPKYYSPNFQLHSAVRQHYVQRKNSTMFYWQSTNPRKMSTRNRQGSPPTYRVGKIDIRLSYTKFMETPPRLNPLRTRHRGK